MRRLIIVSAVAAVAVGTVAAAADDSLSEARNESAAARSRCCLDSSILDVRGWLCSSADATTNNYQMIIYSDF